MKVTVFSYTAPSIKSTVSMMPITAISIGEFGRPTAVIAENPSVTRVSTRSPTPASTESSARTVSPRSEPSSFSGWTIRILSDVRGRFLRCDYVADYFANQHIFSINN